MSGSMANEQFERFRNLYYFNETLGVSLDVSRIRFAPDFLSSMAGKMQKAFEDMKQLEAGAIANPDENRMVGHYWLRAPELAPNAGLTQEIVTTNQRIDAFVADVHHGRIRPQTASKFKNVLVIGIGGSALGPQFVSAALTTLGDRMKAFFFDNTDPDGMDRTLDAIGDELPATLTVVISKSGGTKETRNGMLEAKAAYERLGLSFGRHTVAITGEGSQLDQTAISESFLARFPMWDWVGGRTSELSAVGLVPAALQGLDVHAMLAGAKAMDAVTRTPSVKENPAALLALAWYAATGGQGRKDMVVLPYKDRLELFSRYLQQLVMESLGKWLDLKGEVAAQGISVYGNKGSTDQHAYVQQLRDGVNNFFVTFIEVLRERDPGRERLFVEPETTSGDYLSGFWQGTRQALWERERESLTLTLQKVDAYNIGMLIALYERTVGFYASLVGINAYHQPGVEAGKKAAQAVLNVQAAVVAALKGAGGKALTLDQVAKAASSEDLETVFFVLRHLSANPERGVARTLESGKSVFDATYRWIG